MASTIMAATTSRVIAAKTPFLGQGRTAGNAAPLRDVAAAASGRITMVRTFLVGVRATISPCP
jgi:light-harvesting complex II chlorophyll a/b binding protein 3